MLGRLFKQNPSNSFHHHHNNPNTTTSSSSTASYNNLGAASINASSMVSFEDTYAREILYGTNNANQLKPYVINNKFFRILISQDGGSLRAKQVLYDSASDSQSPNASTPTSPTATAYNCKPFCRPNSLNRNIMTSKVYHNSSELNDYMFGCGLPSNETNCATKVHILPVLTNSVCGPYNSVLVTRLFSISDFEASEQCSDLSRLSLDSSWNPSPTIRVGNTNIRKHLFAKASCNENNNKNNFNSRFAISVVIPLESINDINDVIFNNWEEISHFMVVMQKIVYKKLIMHLNNDSFYDNDNKLTSCPYLINKRIQFPSYMLQGEDIGSQLFKLIKLIYYNANIPKIINCNYLIKSAIKNEKSQYNPMLLNWVLEILNWLEFKDGKNLGKYNYAYNSSFHNNSHSLQSTDLTALNGTCNNNTFLASLLALLIPYRKSLGIRPYHHVPNSKNREITRVVIMTGNPVVAKKLIFIINGIIPYSPSAKLSSYEKNGNDSFNEVNENDDDNSSKFSSFEDFSRSSGNGINPRIHDDFSRNTSVSPRKSSPLNASSHPIPIKPTSLANSYESSDNSFLGSTPSVKGWEIPSKSSASTTTTTPNKQIESAMKGIPIAKASMTTAVDGTNYPSSLSKSSSMAHLSSSLNSSSSSSYSNYSLSKIGGSFMEKWKNSFGASYTSNSMHSIPYSNSNNSNPSGATYFPNSDFAPPASYGSLSKRTSIQSMRTPSPAIEYEEFQWQPTTPMSIANNISHSSNNSQHGTIVGTPTKLSRTQSMYDLYNMNSNGNNVMNEESYNDGSATNSHMKNITIKRAKSSVYAPLVDDIAVKNITEHNKSVIKSKCEEIMKLRYSVKNSHNSILEINPIKTKPKVETHYIDIDEAESFVTDQCTITLKGNGEDGSNRHKYSASRLPVLKNKPLLPIVAFTDEFRSEFSIQSCPVNPKLETQVTNCMKNDLMFYQNNYDYESITSRTVFISLRAREIKVIEMNINNDNSPQDSTISNETNQPLNSYFPETTNSRRSSAVNNNYKTKIVKVFTPNKNLGNSDNINKVDSIFDQINSLFAKQQQNREISKHVKDSGYEALDFNKKLSKLVSTLIC
ncbi:hypothetical protein G9P44_000501 [Scheffersomyces stipitis]|nr:hypothetical protein G9P44_000501 [Scheffersomyces stipitis]